MKERMILWVVQMVMERLSSDDLKKWADMGLDMIEDKVKASPNKFDDNIVLPMCKLVRKSFDIPDND